MRTFILLYLLSFASLFAADQFTVGSFSFEAAEPWKKVQGSRMLKTAYTFGDKGPLVKFYYFGKGQGGGIAANMKRWKGQFQGKPEAKEATKKYGEQEVATIEIAGTYLDGPPFGKKTPKDDYLLLGAVIPHPSGDVFLKMTGPKAEVEKAKAAFLSLVETAFPEE